MQSGPKSDHKGKNKLTPEQETLLALEQDSQSSSEDKDFKFTPEEKLLWAALQNQDSQQNDVSQSAASSSSSCAAQGNASNNTTNVSLLEDVAVNFPEEQIQELKSEGKIKSALINTVYQFLGSPDDKQVPKIRFINKISDNDAEFKKLAENKFGKHRVMTETQDESKSVDIAAKYQSYVADIALRLSSYQAAAVKLIEEKIRVKIEKELAALENSETKESDKSKIEAANNKLELALKEEINRNGDYLQNEIKKLDKKQIQTPNELLKIALSSFVETITFVSDNSSMSEKELIKEFLEEEMYHMYATKQEQGGRETIVTVSQTSDGNYRLQIDKPNPNHITKDQYNELDKIFNNPEAAFEGLKKIFNNNQEKFSSEIDILTKIFKRKIENITSRQREELKKIFQANEEKLAKANWSAKKHLLRLEDQPVWFTEKKKMPAIQAELKKLLGNAKQDGIKSYEEVLQIYITQPSSMKDIPGIHNYGKSAVVVVKVDEKNGYKPEILLQEVIDRSSSFYPENIKNKKNAAKVCKLNLEQHFANLEQYVADYHKMWGLKADQEVHMQMIMMTLVSPLVLGGNDPTHEYDMVHERKLATYKSLGLDEKGNPTKDGNGSEGVLLQKINKIRETYPNVKLDFRNPNFALNSLKNGSKAPADNKICAIGLLDEIWSIADNFPEGNIKRAIQTIKEHGIGDSELIFHNLGTIVSDEKKLTEAFENGSFIKNPNYPAEARAKQFALKIEAVAHYISLTCGKVEEKYPNKNLFKAAYLALSEGRIPSQKDVIDAFNAVILGCKSGKDRTGVALIFISAMREFHLKHGRFHTINDTEKRKEFVNIFCDILFKNHHQVVSSLLNALGAEGLKSVFAWLADDIKAEVEERLPNFIKQNNMLANLNKPEPKYGLFKRVINAITKPLNKAFAPEERQNAIDYYKDKALKALKDTVQNKNISKEEVRIPKLAEIDSVVNFHIQSLHRYIEGIILQDKEYTKKQDKDLGPLVRYLHLLENSGVGDITIDNKATLYALLTSGHPGVEQYRKQLQMPEHIKTMAELLRNDFRQQLNLEEPENYQVRDDFNNKIQAIVDFANDAKAKHPKGAADQLQSYMQSIESFDSKITKIISGPVLDYFKQPQASSFRLFSSKQPNDAKFADYFNNPEKNYSPFMQKVVLYALLADDNKKFQNYMEKQLGNESGKATVKYLKQELAQEFRSEIQKYAPKEYDHNRNKVFNDIVIQSLANSYHGYETKMSDFKGINNMQELLKKANTANENAIGAVSDGKMERLNKL